MLAPVSTGRILQWATAVAVTALGLLVIAGWVGHVRWLVLPPYNAVAMVPDTALSFLASGLALLVLGTSWPQRLWTVRILAVALLMFQAVGMLVLLGDVPRLLDFGTGSNWLRDANPFREPLEVDYLHDARALNPDGDWTRWQVPAQMEDLRAKARAEGLWNLFLPDAEPGAGLTALEYAPLAEAMGRSLIARIEISKYQKRNASA